MPTRLLRHARYRPSVWHYQAHGGGTEIARVDSDTDEGTSLRACYALSGTDIAYQPTGLLRTVRC
eukprot:346227-Rhodomonas_salina.1